MRAQAGDAELDTWSVNALFNLQYQNKGNSLKHWFLCNTEKMENNYTNNGIMKKCSIEQTN
jgi:hypothetical protein